jgi:hypothetical protein
MCSAVADLNAPTELLVELHRRKSSWTDKAVFSPLKRVRDALGTACTVQSLRVSAWGAALRWLARETLTPPAKRSSPVCARAPWSSW